jgi:serine/threonine protein kinase
MIRRYQEQSFKAESEKKAIHVYVNGKFADVNVDYKTMYVELDWGLADILSSASQRLNIPTAKRLFNADGVEINDVMMIMDEDMLFLSNGEAFAGAPKPQQINANGSATRDPHGNDSDDDVSDFNAKEDGDGRPRSGGINDRFAAKSDNLPPVIGNFKVSSFLGRGGFGVVRVGKHQLTEERVALKFINKNDILSIAAAERTMTEIQCLTTLKHNNIILLNEYVETANHVVLMFELMLGGDLLSYLKSQDREIVVDLSEPARVLGSVNDDTSGVLGQGAVMTALPEEDARTVFYQIVSAVSFAHNHHICHRDLKLENILLKKKGSIELVKVADFGLSDFYRPGSTRKSNCGTLAFLAPEGFRNTSNAGPPLDVWSLGVILFALLFGRLPFDDTIDRATERDSQKPAGVVGGRYDLEERDKDNARREEGGRPLYNNKDVHAGIERHRLSETRMQVGRAQDKDKDKDKQQLLDDEVEAKEMQKKKVPRPDQVIRSKIARCQYSFDPPVRSNSELVQPRRPVSLEARDLIRRMLVLDPDDRASVPEICSHIWTRSGVENHHNHPTPRGSGKLSKDWRSRSSSVSSEDMGSTGSVDSEKVNGLPGIPITSPLVRQSGKNGVPAALTRQMSREQYEIPEDERIEILGSGKLAFGSLASSVPRNEESSSLDGGDGVESHSQSNYGKNDHVLRDAMRPTSASASGNSNWKQNSERRVSAVVDSSSSDMLSSLVHADNDDASGMSRRGSVNDPCTADNGSSGIATAPVRAYASLPLPSALPTDDALTKALSESHIQQQNSSYPQTTPVTTPVQTHSSIALAGGSSINSLTMTGSGPGGIPSTTSGSILMPLRRLPVPVRSFENDDYLRGKKSDDNDSLGQALKLSPRLSTSEKVPSNRHLHIGSK